jgi:predicted dithiol-disulfide oxidoreductase (DUF899 family)
MLWNGAPPAPAAPSTRGLDMLLGAHHYLDIAPEGRNKSAHPNWPRRRDEYDKTASAE